jgi:prepilin-type processing-associated H-X9-DG protein
MMLWEAIVLKPFLFFVVPAVLGCLAGLGMRSRLLQRSPVGLTVLLCVLGVASYIPLASAWYPTRAIWRQKQCANNLDQIGLALTKYADTHQGHLPSENGAKGLDDLLRQSFFDGEDGRKAVRCPWDDIRHTARSDEPLTEDTVSYVYAGGTLHSESYTNVVTICWDKIENHNNIGLNVLFNDGHVQWMTIRQWEKIRPAK